jgi:carboxymethylenebutenolidase
MKPQEMVNLFQDHMNAELTGDLDTAMSTMTDNPHLTHVPTMAGAVGREEVKAFYRDHLVGKFSPQMLK